MSLIVFSRAPIRKPWAWKRTVFHVAPMMEYTDHHQRQLMKLLSNNAILYTEMITAQAVVRNHAQADAFRYMGKFDFDPSRTVIQLGGSCPTEMADAAKIAVEYGYSAININAGCPSPRVAAGYFGASLMLEPELLLDIVKSIADATGVVPSVKCRIGVNDDFEYSRLCDLIGRLHVGAGVKDFTVHARMAILNKKFTPADNRKIPPLRYDVVHKLVEDFPQLPLVINGGIRSYDEAKTQLGHGLKGVKSLVVAYLCDLSVIEILPVWCRSHGRPSGSGEPILLERR